MPRAARPNWPAARKQQPVSDHPTPRPPRSERVTDYDRWRQNAYLRVTALRAAVEIHSLHDRTDECVVTTAIAFHDFLTE